MCGVAVTLEGRRVLEVKGDPNDPFSKGHICPKAVALKDIHEDPDRLTEPLVRDGGHLRPATWEEALDRAAEGLQAVRDKHGRAAVAIYQGNPSVHSIGTLLYALPFVQALRTPNHFSATSLDQLPHMLAAYQMFGHQLALPVPDLDHCDFLVVQGANPLVSNGSLMSAGDVRARLDGIRKRGGKIVVIDPRRTETAARADEHLFIRPGTDALLLAAVAQALLHDHPEAPGRLADVTDGLDTIAGHLAPFTPEAVADTTGLSPSTIRRLAEDFVRAPAGAWYGRIGICTQEFGGTAGWLLYVVNILAGALDRKGGMMFPKPAIDLVEIATRIGRKGSFDRRRTRVRDLPEFGGEFPAAALAEEIDTPGEGQIRALVTSSGNPVLSAPNGARLEKALPKLDFMVSVDIYVNETTQHAQVILPPTFGVERAHYDLAFTLLAVRNTVKYSPPAFDRTPNQRHDWEIFGELFRRMRKRGLLTEMAPWLEAPILKLAHPERILDLGLRFGPYGDSFKPFGEGLSLSDVKDSIHGIDLGPLEPRLPDRLQNDTKRIQLVPEIYLQDIRRLKGRLGRVPKAGTLSLIGRRELRSNNSWMHNTLRMVKGKMRCTLRMHPEDAAARGLEHGADVEIASAVGKVVAPLEVTDEIAPGVVSLPHGYGHHRSGSRLRVAAEHAGVSANDLTDSALIDELTGNARFSDVPVVVTGAGAPS